MYLKIEVYKRDFELLSYEKKNDKLLMLKAQYAVGPDLRAC